MGFMFFSWGASDFTGFGGHRRSPSQVTAEWEGEANWLEGMARYLNGAGDVLARLTCPEPPNAAIDLGVRGLG